MSTNTAWFRQLNPETHRTIQRFLDERCTGSIQINVSEGQPKTAIVKEHIRVAAEDGPPAPFRSASHPVTRIDLRREG